MLVRVLAALLLTAWIGAPNAATITVNTASDQFGSGASCSLREAIQSANINANFGGCVASGTYGSDTIVLPAADFVLTRSGLDDDNNDSDDLDIRGDLVIDGASAGSTSIEGPNNHVGRIIHIHNGTVLLRDLTIQGGNATNGRAGGGLRAEPGTTTDLFNVVLGLNRADGSGGGILNRGTMRIEQSAIGNNETVNATQGGGGIFNAIDSTLTIVDSLVIDNIATGPDSAFGGGIFNDEGALLEIENSTISGNLASTARIGSNAAGGGGIACGDADAPGGRLILRQSTVSGNVVGSKRALGAGIFIGTTSGQSRIERTLVTANEIEPGVLTQDGSGGGVRVERGAVLFIDSIVSNNTVLAYAYSRGGGISAASAVEIRDTSITGNRAINAVGSSATVSGGGVDLVGGGTLTNVTIANNRSEELGGGLSVSESLDVEAFNVTIAGNTANTDSQGTGQGGGVSISGSAALRLRNSVIAGNVNVGGAQGHDCSGSVFALAPNFIRDQSGCDFVGLSQPPGGGVDALLGPLADHGGPPVGASNATAFAVMLTHRPLSASPLIDAGDEDGCRNAQGSLIAFDQRGAPRAEDGPDADFVAQCDLGAVELEAEVIQPNEVFRDGFE